MASSRQRYLILILGRIFQQIKSFGSRTIRALSLLLRRILVWWGLSRSKLKFGGKGVELKSLPPPKSDNGSKEPNSANLPAIETPTQGTKTTISDEVIPYTMVTRGETVSMADASFSLSPYTSARKGAGSAQSLHAQRSSHNLSIISHQASRSSHFSGSEVSLPASAKSEDYVFQVQRSPTLASSPYGPHRQFSMSEPQIGSPTRRPIELTTESIHIPSEPSPQRLSHVEPPQSIEIMRSQSPVPCYLDNPRITPCMPESTRRYERRGFVPMEDYDIRIAPLKLDFTSPIAPAGWTKFIHPEGARYFYHREKRIYTESDLFDKKIFSTLSNDIATIEYHISNNHISMPDNCVMFIDTEYSEDGDFKGYSSTYYFVDHRTRGIFFIDEFESMTMRALREVWGCRTDMHLGHEIEAQYWYFVQLYPDSLPISSDMIAELRDIVLHLIGDSMSSVYSISPLNLEDLHKILGLANSLEKNIGKKCVGSISFLGRFMYIFAHSRFQNFYGESCARLERDVSVHGPPDNHRTWLVRLLSPILFSAPDVHLKLLRKMYVDGIMKHAVWETSVKKMNEEWQEFILFATVLLNANVAFLAIQSIDTNIPSSYRSPAQIASYLSVVVSIGSIILGLLLIRQHRTKHKETADDVTTFLARREHKTRGLETLAILHSLPYALLMWGMVSFLVAFCLVCLDDSNTSTRIITISAFTAMGALIGWCVWSAWESQPESPPPPIGDPDTIEEKISPTGSKRTSISDTSSSSEGNQAIWRWVSGLNILKKLRKGSLDSERTAV